MEIKNVLKKFKTAKQEKKAKFLALEISNESVKSAVWTVDDGKTQIVKLGSIEERKEGDEDSFIDVSDRTISKATEGMEKEVQSVIFGLPSDWLDANQVAKDKKLRLKKLCQRLGLKPLGFVLTHEAVLEYLKITEGVPVNAILIGLEESQATIILVELGKILGFQLVGRSDDLAADVREGLTRFSEIKNFPARMILYDGAIDFEEAKQQLISFDWQEKLPFFHLPKIEALEAMAGVRAVAIAGGAEVAKSLGIQVDQQQTEDELEEEGGEEIQNQKEQASEEGIKEAINDQVVSAEEVGFVADKDILDEEKYDQKPLKEINKQEEVEEHEQIKELKIRKPNKIKFYFLVIKERLKRALTILFSLFSFSSGKKSLLILVLFTGLFLLAAGLFAFYWYIPKAEIKLIVEAKTLEKELTIILDPQASQLDEEKNVIPVEKTNKEVKGTRSSPATGEKLIGDKAEGEIIIYNKTDIAKSFEAGTILVGGDKLQFRLLEEETVASKSSETTSEGENIIYGKATAKIQAGSIGSEYNLQVGSQFSFKDYPSSLYIGKIESDLSGGASRNVRAVSDQDLKTLKADLTKELIQKAQSELKSETKEDEEVIITNESQVLKEQFSAKAEDEAEQVDLDLNLQLTAFIYKKEELKQLLQNIFKTNVPAGFNLGEVQTPLDVKKTTIGDNNVHLFINANVKLVPIIETEGIKQNLVGRRPSVAQEYLKALPNLVSAEVRIMPKLPAAIEVMPHKTTNITIQIETTN